jgi:uncharacterized protein YndB with AHSA1/START domain
VRESFEKDHVARVLVRSESAFERRQDLLPGKTMPWGGHDECDGYLPQFLVRPADDRRRLDVGRCGQNRFEVRRPGVDGCLNGRMTTAQEQPRVVSASREIAAGPGRIFELIADPAQQPRWDGNDNLAEAPAGQRVRRAGEVFTMTLTHDGAIRENHVVEFEEGRRIAWRPAESGRRPPGHLWRWELEPAGASRTRVTCTYDWTQLTDQKRLRRARATTAGKLRSSIDRLAALAEAP